MSETIDGERLAECIAELYMLARIPRIGWSMAGVTNPESVAVHCFQTAQIAYILSKYTSPPVDLGKVLAMALFHEVGEVRLSDLPRRAGPYIKSAKNAAERAISRDVLAGVTDDLSALLDEFHECKTLEARVAEAAEELQIIFAAMMYAKERNGDMSEYIGDAAKYDALGVPAADAIADVVRIRLAAFAGGHPHWPLGYRR